MIPALRYAWLTVKHKWFVFLAGMRMFPLCPILWPTLFWRLLTHDLSKFGPAEIFPYGRQFFGAKDRPEEFIRAWIHHQNHNDHHWEYWIPRTGHNRCNPPFLDNEPVDMPLWAVVEMIADWAGVSRAYEGRWPGTSWPWVEKNLPGILPRLGPNTRSEVNTLMWCEFRVAIYGKLPAT